MQSLVAQVQMPMKVLGDLSDLCGWKEDGGEAQPAMHPEPLTAVLKFSPPGAFFKI